MIVSTKGRYALRVMVCLALRDDGEYVPLKEIAEAEGTSQKYLESIMTLLSKGCLVDAVHGKGGGYRLNRKPEQYTVGIFDDANIPGVHKMVHDLFAIKCHIFIS